MPRQLWIIERQKGQLGNRLMFFAAAYAYALAEGRQLYLPALHRYAELFPALAGQRWPSPNDPSPDPRPAEARAASMQRRVKILRALGRLHLLPGTIRKPSGHSAIALPPTLDDFPPAGLRRRGSQYMLAWRFFNPVGVRRFRHEILRATTPSPAVELAADAFINTLPPDRLWIGLHARGTDYAGFLGGKHLHTPTTLAAHARALAALLPHRRPAFVIFSDTPRAPSEFPGIDAVVSNADPVSDLARLSRLKLIIGPMSTFTAWAAFRSGGAVWHIGPSPDEDGLGWVYSGYPVVRSAQALAEALAWIETGQRFEPPIDASPDALRPRKLIPPPAQAR